MQFINLHFLKIKRKRVKYHNYIFICWSMAVNKTLYPRESVANVLYRVLVFCSTLRRNFHKTFYPLRITESSTTNIRCIANDKNAT